ncbi:MAG TPA: AAA family ATPase, partial [bacterium]|nr:AAA family ATPase [bacterium]
MQNINPDSPVNDSVETAQQPARTIRFKKLELQGFKSFPDRTELMFDKDICAIVGPNGCGKSNILDAIRWVLGEQGPSQLRARAMADVIFNGAAGRKPVGMAEIALTVECPDGTVPMAYHEIEVTRRLYRSGDSEYLINRTPCRLKDIVDLFLDTGIGKGAYSLIEQGRVDALVTARPEERRMFIEQTAGIEKYKVRKKDALSKLTSTEHNLERVMDVLSEVRSRRISLSRQARKAVKYRTLRKELDEIRRLIVTGRYARIQEQIKTSSRDLEVIQNRMARNSAQHGLQAAALQESRKQVERVQSELARAGEVADQAEMRMDYLEKRLSDLRNREAELEKESRDGFQEADAMDARRRELETRVAALVEERSNRVMLLDTLQESMGAIETEHQTAIQDVIRARETLSNLRTRRLEQVEAISRHQNRLSALDEGIRRLEHRIGQLALEAARHTELEADAGTAVEVARSRVETLETECDEMRRKVASCIQEKKTLEEAWSESRMMLRSAENELLAMESRLKSLEEIRAAGEGLDSGVRAVLDSFRVTRASCRAGEIRGTLADLYDALPDCEQALSAVLHPCLQDIIVDTPDAFLAVERFLMERRLGRVTVRNAAAMPAVPGGKAPEPDLISLRDCVTPYAGLELLFHEVLNGVYLVEDADAAADVAVRHPEIRIVTRDGQIRGPGPEITIARTADSRSAYRRRRMDIRALENRL